LAFPGALDISLLARLLVDHRMHRLRPAQQLLADDSGGAVRLAASDDQSLIALYLPYATDVDVALDLAGHRLTGWDLAERAPLTPDLAPGGTARLRQLPTAGDQLVIAERAA
ncbi:MAG TPA: hypothetical protein VGP16_16435, partial [Asanoa sp.]|nr:hypothetical protein [Asanoa sp.]